MVDLLLKLNNKNQNKVLTTPVVENQSNKENENATKSSKLLLIYKNSIFFIYMCFVQFS